MTAGGGRERRAHVEHHLDVGTEELLDGDAPLRREVVTAAVVGGAEGGAVVGDLRLEREDLEATRVGEDVTAPVGEAVETPEIGDEIGPGPQHQVVGVGQHHLDPELLEVRGAERPHHRPGADGHEARGAERAARGVHHPGPRRPVGRLDVEPDDPARRIGHERRRAAHRRSQEPRGMPAPIARTHACRIDGAVDDPLMAPSPGRR